MNMFLVISGIIIGSFILVRFWRFFLFLFKLALFLLIAFLLVMAVLEIIKNWESVITFVIVMAGIFGFVIAIGALAETYGDSSSQNSSQNSEPSQPAQPVPQKVVQISRAKQQGEWVYVFDMENRQLFAQRGILKNYNTNTVSIQIDRRIYTYDTEHRQIACDNIY